MKIETVTSSPGLAALRGEWERFEARAPWTPYYVTHRFVSAWWAAYAETPGYTLHVMVVRHNDRLVGIAPFAIHQRSVRGQSVRALRWASHGDYLDVLVDPSSPSATVCRAMVEAATMTPGIDRIRLGYVLAEGHLAHYLLKSEHNAEFTPLVENPYLDLTEFDDLDDFANRAGIPSHTRKYRNKLFRERQVTFRVFEGNEEDILNRLAGVHRAEKEFLITERSRRERHSLFEDASREALVRAIFEHTDDALTFGYQDSEGNLLGYRTCFRHGRTLLSWNSAYHPELHPYRIGKVIQFDILDHLLAVPPAERDVDVFDFGAGRYPWKFEWTNRFQVTYLWRHVLRPGPSRSKTAPAPRKAPAAKQVPATNAQPPKQPPPPPAAEPVESARPAKPDTGWAARAARSLARRARTAVRRRTTPPVIWYVPHPDDETIFMGGSIHRTRDRKNILVLLTRGGASKALGKLNTKLEKPLEVQEFMAGRATEMAAALKAIGVRERDLLRRDLPDGAVESDAVLQIIREMARRHPGAQHRTMSYLDPHPDHSAAGRALRRAHSDGTVSDAVFHLPVPLVSAQLGTRVRLGKVDLAAKQQALREYQVWDPTRGRYAIGNLSVASLIRRQLSKPRERVHGPDFDG